MSTYFNPRSPWGERLYICSPCRGDYEFQSTLSVGRATSKLRPTAVARAISIHALRGESDFSTTPALICMDLFQSTPSARRATLSLSRVVIL